jgi:hypothetical protein
MASVFGGIIGGFLFGFRGERPGSGKPNLGSGGYLMWALFFTVTGAVVGYSSLTDDSYGDDSQLGGIIVGATFLAMGLPVLLFVIWAKVSDWRDPAPDDRFQPSYGSTSSPATTPTSPGMVPTSWPMAGAGSPPSAPVGGVDPELDELMELEKLERLQKLREAGALTDAEFEQQKRRILDD